MTALAGLPRDGHGRLGPSHAVEAGPRYRNDISHGVQRREGEADAWRSPAHDVGAVPQRIGSLLRRQTAASTRDDALATLLTEASAAQKAMLGLG